MVRKDLSAQLFFKLAARSPQPEASWHKYFRTFQNHCMKSSCSFVLVVFLAIASCTNTEQQTTRKDSLTGTDTLPRDTVVVIDTVLSGCYSMMVNRDTASLQMQVKGSQATGSISYDLDGKDRNDGTFEGEVMNDRLTGWYLFRSEGLMSVRQVAFRIGNGYLWPANGEVMVRNDSTFFKDISKLNFDSTRPFVKVRCVI